MPVDDPASKAVREAPSEAVLAEYRRRFPAETAPTSWYNPEDADNYTHRVAADLLDALDAAEREAADERLESAAWRAKARDKGEAMRAAEAEVTALRASLVRAEERAEAAERGRDANRAREIAWSNGVPGARALNSDDGDDR